MTDVDVGTEMEVRPPRSIAQADELTIDQLVAQVQKVQQAMRAVMKDGEHFGTIPGTNKPTLLKPGAEKLCLLFRLAPTYKHQETWDGDHLTVITTCTLVHGPSGNLVAAGEGMCSTKESKYAYRKSSLACPECGNTETCKKSKNGPGWYCWSKIGGCGWKTSDDNDPGIRNQNPGKIDNPDLPDQYNTVLKMAAKRALIAAVLNGTAASDIFTQDLEEKVSGGDEPAPASLLPATSPPEVSESPARPSQTESLSAPDTGVETQAGQDVGDSAKSEEGDSRASGEVGSVTPSSEALADSILNSVDAGFVKINPLLHRASQLALEAKALPKNGLGRSTLSELPAAILLQLSSEFNISQEALSV